MKLQVKLIDLFRAYRQAKTNVFFERRGVSAECFSEFEEDIEANLIKVQKALSLGQLINSAQDIGTLLITEKALEFEEPNTKGLLIQEQDYRDEPQRTPPSTISLRTQLAPTAEFAVFETLWLQKYGGFIENFLSESCYGSRMHTIGEGANKRIDKERRSSFKYYISAYKKWRQDPLSRAKRALEAGQRISLYTLDIRSYYDNLSPAFMIDRRFFEQFEEFEDFPPGYIEWTSQLLGYLQCWQSYVIEWLGILEDKSPQLPVGISFSRIVANIALAPLDNHAEQADRLIYYGRYVDDVNLLVDTSDIADSQGSLSTLLSTLPIKQSTETLVLDTQALRLKGSVLELQTAKTKCIRLSGEAGLAQINRIDKQNQVFSSEWRYLGDPEALDKSKPFKIVALVGNEQEPLGSKNQTERLKERRYSAAVTLSHLVRFTRLLSPESWKGARERYYEQLVPFLTNQRVYPGLSHLAFKLLKVMISNGDYDAAYLLIQRQRRQHMNRTSILTINDVVIPAGLQDQIYELLAQSLRVLQRDAVLVGIRTDLLLKRDRKYPLDEEAIGVDEEANGVFETVVHKDESIKSFLMRARLIKVVDLSFHGYRNEGFELLQSVSAKLTYQPLQVKLLQEGDRSFNAQHLEIQKFLESCGKTLINKYSGVIPIQMMLLTRPPTLFEISTLWFRDQQQVGFKNIINALRGTKYREEFLKIKSPDRNISRVELKDDYTFYPKRPFKPKGNACIGVGNISMKKEWFDKSLRGEPVLTAARYADLARILNAAIAHKPRPDFIVFPELSIPRLWVEDFARQLANEKIGLIAGLEYLPKKITNSPASRSGRNEVLVTLPGKWATLIAINRAKTMPAYREEEELKQNKIRFEGPGDGEFSPGTVFKINRLYTGVLICSELTDITFRSALRGAVDVLAIAAWNRDVNSFAHLIESAALDIHSYISCANDATYSDSRIRAPYNKSYNREVARIIATNQNLIVFGIVDYNKLRDEQTGMTLGDSPSGYQYKPIPRGFEIRYWRESEDVLKYMPWPPGRRDKGLPTFNVLRNIRISDNDLRTDE